VKIEKNADKFVAKTVQKYTPAFGIASEQQSPIYYNGFVYSVQPKDAGALRNQFVCYKPDDCTKLIWASGKSSRFGLGPYFLINDKFLVLDDNGTLTLFNFSTTKYTQIAQCKLFDGQDAWGPMAFADGYLLLRDSKKMFCVDLK